ncbi:MAG: exodeoxyribonuclease VII large subunit [Vicinamibacteria bacterium]|nr:exodeoxyribonuclease VII large subunit [Vicinamibacteria bacterium]
MAIRRPPPPPHRAALSDRPLKDRLQSTLFEPEAGDASVPPPLGPPPEGQGRTPISISELTERISQRLTSGFSSVCVMGEISQVKVVSSGHTYFTLKDAGATLEAMVWADRRAGLGVEPKQGLRVVAQGALRVFAAQGRYSLHVEALELLGAGDLQRALESLKARLLSEGLFADARKRSLPRWLRTVGLVTSPTGAVRHDIERTLTKGGARVRLLLSPTRVQGEGAGPEIAAALRLLSDRDDVDVIIVARGGGSVEELWPFNEETVARAIAASRPPVISAVGHETDFTIADLVADIRASTPSGAASMVLDIQREAALRTEAASQGLFHAMQSNQERWRRRLDAVSTHRVMERERTRLERLRGRLGEAFARVRVAVDRRQASRRSTFRDLATRCEAQAPRQVFSRAHARVDRAVLSMGAQMAASLDRKRARATRAFESKALRDAEARLLQLTRRFSEDLQHLGRAVRPVVEARRSRFGGLLAKLDALSPLAVLSRGYALATTVEGRILLDAKDVSAGDSVVVRLSRGRLRATVTEREEEA